MSDIPKDRIDAWKGWSPSDDEAKTKETPLPVVTFSDGSQATLVGPLPGPVTIDVGELLKGRNLWQEADAEMRRLRTEIAARDKRIGELEVMLERVLDEAPADAITPATAREAYALLGRKA